jgi:cytochrome c peroxidase
VTVPLPSPAAVLPLTLARFKTPTLRDLGQSDPYLHTGRMDTIEDVIQFYQTFSELARRGRVRNADPQLSGIDVDDPAAAALAAFLRALNEDYTD